jgi:HK97 family phage portal protein
MAWNDPESVIGKNMRAAMPAKFRNAITGYDVTYVDGKKTVVLHKQGVEVIEITDHPLLSLLHRPNDTMSWPDFITTVISYFSILGNCYLLPNFNGDRQITRLKTLLSEYMWLLTDGDGTITQYQYYPASQEWITHFYEPKQVIHLMTPSAGSTVSGRGWLEAVQKECRLIEEANNHLIALANNMGQPGAIITIHGKAGSEKEKETVVQKFMQRFTQLKRGKPLVTFTNGPEDKIDVQPSGLNPKEMAYTDNLPWLRSAVCAAAGVPEDLIHSGHSNRSSSQTAMASFLSYTVCPHLNSILEQFNHRLTPAYEDDVFLAYDPNEIMKDDPVIQSTVLKTYVQAGIMTPNEAREFISLPPKNDGDNLVAASSSNLRGNERLDSGSHSGPESTDVLRNPPKEK